MSENGTFRVHCLDVECTWMERGRPKTLVERFAENHEDVYGHETGYIWPGEGSVGPQTERS